MTSKNKASVSQNHTRDPAGNPESIDPVGVKTDLRTKTTYQVGNQVPDNKRFIFVLNYIETLWLLVEGTRCTNLTPVTIHSNCLLNNLLEPKLRKTPKSPNPL